MGCVRCGECCRKFRITFNVGEGPRRSRARGQKFLISKYSPDPKFGEFLKVMGVNLGHVMVKIPLDQIPEDAKKVSLVFNRVCTQLNEELNLCRIHDTKPEFCRNWMCGVARTPATDVLIPDKIEIREAGDESEEEQMGGEGIREVEGAAR